MSSPCWSFPHLLTSRLPQHEEPPGQHDLLRDDTPNRQPLPQEPLPASSGNYSVGKQRAVGKHSQKWANYIFQRASKAGSCSCQLSTTVYGMRMKKLVKISQKEWKNTLEDFLAVIGLSFFLVKKRSGTPHTIANQTDPGIGLRRRRCKIPRGLVTQYSVVPVRW